MPMAAGIIPALPSVRTIMAAADIGAFRISKGNWAMLSLTTVAATLLYAFLGIFVFVVSFVLVDKLTPGELWKEIIEKQNTAVALLSGAVALGLSVIIAAAVHG